MKQKCSFILKASTALVLCFLMLFGTVTTSLAAVVDNADTGAEAELAGTSATGFTVYCVPKKIWSSYTSSDTIKIRTKPDASGWNLTTANMTKTSYKYDGEDVWQGTGYKDGGFNNLQFSRDNGSNWSGYAGWTTDTSSYEGKVYDGTNWNEAVWDSTTTLYVKKSLIDSDGWTNIHLYNENNVNNGAWPGVSTSGWATYGDYYKYELTKPWNKLFVILNKGQGGDQTADMSSGVNMGNSYIIDSATKNTALTLTQGTPVIAPSIELSTNKSTIVMDGSTASETATITTTISNSSATASYTVTKDGSAATSGTHYTLSSGVFTPKTTGTFVITGSITDGGTHTDSVTITSVARSVYFKTNTTGGSGTKDLTGNAMTYDSTLSTSGKAIYKYSKSLSAGNNYIVVYDSGDDKNLSYNNGTLSQTLLSSSGYTIYEGDNNVDHPLKVNASPAGTYNFYFDANNNKLYVEFPHTVTFNSKGGSAVSSQVITYGGKATKPSDPTKDGYDFDTWVTIDGGSTAFNFTNTTITADTTVYAKWTAQNRTLTVDAYAKETSSGSYTVAATSITNQLKIANVTQTSASVAVGSTVTVAAPATDPAGYVFVGWYDGTTQKSTSRSYTYTMGTTAKTLTARYDRKYTLTISKATDNGTVNATSKEVYYNDAPGDFTVTPSTGYRIKYANCTNLSTYYTTPSGTTGTQTMTGKSSIASASKVNTTITIAFEEITPVVNFTSYKTDDNSTYSLGGGELTAAWTTESSGGGDSGSEPESEPAGGPYYLHIGKQSAFRTNTAIQFTWSGSYYYASYNVDTANADYPFVINTKNTALGDSDKSSSSQSVTTYASTWDPDNIGSNINYHNYNSNNFDGFATFKFSVKSAATIYITFTPSGGVAFRTSISSGSGSSGSGSSGSGSGSSTSGSVTSGGTVPYGATVTFSASRSAVVDDNDYMFEGWYSTAQPASNETALSTELTYTKSNVNDDVSVYARYKKVLYLTFYNSYMRESPTADWQFVAAPPRTVTVGTGSSTRATYTYKAGNAEQRGEEHTVNATGDYYEGNTLLVLVGETVTLKFSTLASSDAIRGIFFNNDRRYTTETEENNLYYHREYKAGGWGDAEHGYDSGVAANDVPDDDWEYTYLADTTIYADENYYDGATATTIHNNYNSYVGKNAMDQSTHEISWVATQSYLNIDIELDKKYQLHINDDEWEGLKIENMNDEGYYFGGETFANNFKISIDNSDVTDGTYAFTGTTATVTDKDGNSVSGVTVTAKDSSGNTTSDLNQLSYFLVSGTMPRTNAYINIPAVKQYKMRLANIVVSDNGTNKRTMLTECSSNSTSATDCIGSITAVPKTDGTPGEDISSDGTYYTYPSNNNAGEVSIYTSSTNNKYLKGGVNKNGSTVAAGSTVTYTFTFASGKDAEYTFVGWFEGDKNENGDTFTPNYKKKLSGKQTFTYTPTKDTIVFAVGTRDVYIGGNFTSAGAYTTTDANKTWASGRILMDFDPTYTNPEDSTKKGRYVYKFDSVTPNTEYQFRCYDTASGTAETNLTLWKTWNGSSDYAQNNDDILFGRHKYEEQYGTSHGQFIYKNSTASSSLSENTDSSNATSTKNHQANGYAAPVEVYFYAYDGGITVNSTYQWSRAYVSAGVGIDVKSVSGGTTTYNVPTVSVASKTVNNKDVTVTDETYGQEAIKNCLVKENNGQIVVTASPADENVELQAFLVYNIDTKKSEAVKTFTTSGSGAIKAYIGNITIPNNSKIYVVPIYKFTDHYIYDVKHLETHDVYVRADDIDKDDWGGLVAMYSWGTESGYDSGGWPGQLMVPSDDGNSFIAPLTFQAGGLAGVTFNNYTKVWGGDFVNFLGMYQDEGISDVAYSGYTKPDATNNYIYQVYDYREPISIIDNINTPEPKIYDSEDMTLTFELKPGNKTSGTVGNGDYSASFDYEYLTDSSGKYRVDLNGNKLSTNSTATYYVVCNYTEDYNPSDGTKTYGFAPATKNRYSIDWNVYDINGVAVANGTQLSASFTDVDKSEMLTYIAKQLIDDGRPVSGKAVKIAYENPKVSSSDNTEAVRYSGQWYADGINTIIEGNVRVGIYSDGAWLPSDTNAPGYGTATVEFAPDASKGEEYVTEDGCTGNSMARVTKIHAANGDVTFRVSTTDNFLGWYREDGNGGYEPIGSNYMNQTVSLSFNEDITYYAFYNASASYRVKYTGRNGDTKFFTAKGTDLTEAELANGGILDSSTRSLDITTKLSKARTEISVFNKSYELIISNPTSTAYTLTYDAAQAETSYTLTPYAYNTSGTLAIQSTVSGNWSKSHALPLTYTMNKPTEKESYKFAGWIPYNYDESKYTAGTASTYPQILSTQANFGYSITQNISIKPFFVSSDSEVTAVRGGDGWQAGIDKIGITQELTSAEAGTIYNDALVNFRNKADSGEKYDPSTNECGVVILFQNKSANSDNIDAFNSLTDGKVQSVVNSMVSSDKTSARLGNTNFGCGTDTTFAYRVKATSLSNMNRANLFMGVDYAKYSGCNFKLVSYTKVGDTYSYSDIKTGTFTMGPVYPVAS